MTIGILIFSEPKEEGPSSADQFIDAAKKQGYEAVKLYEPFFRFERLNGKHEIYYDGKPFQGVDIVLGRPNFIEEPSLHAHTIALLEEAGYPVVNGVEAMLASKNKLVQHEGFIRHNLPSPRFAIVGSLKEVRSVAKAIGFPLIVKVAFGTHGKGVFYCENLETFLPIVDYLLIRDGNPLIIEEFVEEANRRDIRAIVVGNDILGAMERIAPAGDIRANMAQGGTAEATTLSSEEESLVLNAAKAFKLDIAGIDFLRTKNGPLLIEVNANPGFKGFDAATGIETASRIIEYLANQKTRS